MPSVLLLVYDSRYIGFMLTSFVIIFVSFDKYSKSNLCSPFSPLTIMSFSALPPELKIYIVKVSHEARLKEAHQDPDCHQVSVFNGGYHDGPKFRSKAIRRRMLEGSVVESVSLVNKELRSIALPYLFEVSLFFALKLCSSNS